MAEFQEKMPLRAALYIDGFNLYHAIDDYKQNFLKWLNLWRIGEILCAPTGLLLTKVVFCTAVPDQQDGTRQRHVKYNNALISCGVTVVKGHHIIDPDSGKRTEKQSDINLALSVMCDAIDNVFDVAFILSADSDQAATGRFMNERFSAKTLYSVAPIDRSPPEKLRPYCKKLFSLNIEQIEAAVLPGMIQGKNGLIVRPTEYDPPAGWVHPDNRPRKKGA